MTTEQDLRIDLRRGAETDIVRLAGEIDYGTVSRLRTALLELSREESTAEVVVDMAEVSFIDSTALSVLVQAKQRLEASGRSLRISDPQPKVDRVLELGGLRDYLT